MSNWQKNSQKPSQPQHVPLYKANRAVWCIYMAMMHPKSYKTDRVWQEGQFIKVRLNDKVKIYLIDKIRGVLREIT